LSVRARPLIGLSVVLSIFSTASAKCCGVLKLFRFRVADADASIPWSLSASAFICAHHRSKNFVATSAS
jgi:hypothetical protein